MHLRIATIAVAALITSLVTPTLAWGAPVEALVRIEGKSQTLFEGPIRTEGHPVKASSDSEEHNCDGVVANDPQQKTPGPTPIAAAVDAMELIGETFDGQWYPGFEDYLITRWGPDREEEGMSWGLIVNNVFTSIGGCQYVLSAGTEVLWVYNAFEHRPFLALYPAGADTGPRPLTATAALGEPFEVEVLDYSDDNERVPPASPIPAGSVPFQGADVSPVITSPKGFEKVETESPDTVTSDAQGKASITFTEPGWHRIKATVIDASGEEDAIRSNRLDVCVPAKGADSCPGPFPEDQARTAPHTLEQEAEQAEKAKRQEEEAKRQQEEAERKDEEANREEEAMRRQAAAKAEGEQGQSKGPGARSEALAFTAQAAGGLDPVRVGAPALDGLGAARGLVGVSWQVLDPGAGIASWTISSRTLSAKSAVYVTRATGSSASSALFALPPGSAYELQLTIVDTLGRSSVTAIGKVLVPEDDRWGGLRYEGRWRHAALAGAWLDTISAGAPGARVSTRLAAGRPVFLLRASSRSAKVEVRAGGRGEVFSVAAGPTAVSRTLTAVERPRAGTVGLRVLTGSIDLDGVGVEP